MDFAADFDKEGNALDGEKLFEKIKAQSRWAEGKLLVNFGTMGAVRMCFDLDFEVPEGLRVCK